MVLCMILCGTCIINSYFLHCPIIMCISNTVHQTTTISTSHHTGKRIFIFFPVFPIFHMPVLRYLFHYVCPCLQFLIIISGNHRLMHISLNIPVFRTCLILFDPFIQCLFQFPCHNISGICGIIQNFIYTVRTPFCLFQRNC